MQANTASMRISASHLEEHAVSLLHDVGLVHCCHAPPVVQERKLKRILRGAQRALLGDDLAAAAAGTATAAAAAVQLQITLMLLL
jgi:hypothetical protein